MARFFNTAGQCRRDIHYMLDPLRRLVGVRQLIERQAYFVIHGPRQSGQSTALATMAEVLNAEGDWTSVLLSVERGRAYPDDPSAAQAAILRDWALRLPNRVPASLRPAASPVDFPDLSSFLATWAQQSQRHLAIFLDEVDALEGATMLDVLSQLRTGHSDRPRGFPSSIALIGMRDIRDYKVASGGSAHLGGPSPFNVKEASLVMRSFTRDEVAELYAQHTADTGQVFGVDAVDMAFRLSEGQPWLVNALAREATDVLVTDRERPVTAAHIDDARELLIRRRDTHFDSLAERLREDRVRRVVEPMLTGGTRDQVSDDDREYAMDLGFVRVTRDGSLRLANPIYHDAMPRMLSAGTEQDIPSITPTWLAANGDLDFPKLLDSFLTFWRQHGEAMIGAAPYHEAAPYIVLMAFLHRVSNGKGVIDREYAIGLGRMDLLVKYGAQRLALELKVWHPGDSDPKTQGLEQLDLYLAGLGLSEGWLVIFDRRPGTPRLRDRTSAEQVMSPAGRRVTVVRA